MVLAYEWTFGSLLWGALVFFMGAALLFMFVGTFADIVLRRDLSGLAKAGWIVLIFILPFLGILIYVIVRPTIVEREFSRQR